MNRESTEESELVANDAEFIAALLLYQYRQDNALGLHHVTSRQRGLLWYYNALQLNAFKDQQAELLKAFHFGVVRGARKRIEQIKELIGIDTPIEQARQLYKEVLILEETIKASTDILNG